MNALIGAGAAAVCGNAFASPEDIQTVLSLFRAVIPFLTAARAIESINKKAYAGVLPAIAVKIEKYCSSNS
jgi:pyrroline-5-carboxylate reductase